MKLLFQQYFGPDCGSIANKETDFIEYIKEGEKIHTIRKDRRNRWIEDEDIEMIMNGKIFFTSYVKKIQKIKIKRVTIDADQISPRSYPLVIIDGQTLSFAQLNELSWNDGFKSLEHFFEYFQEPFEGKLIHWSENITSY